MLYSPRDIHELEALRTLVGISYDFARGTWAASSVEQAITAS
jgi:hypothetical protein